MQIPAESSEIVAAEAMLVPSVVDWGNEAGKNEEERWERAEFVDPNSFLELHPFNDLGGVIAVAPALEINDHNPSVEVTGVSSGEGEGQRGVGPESGGEIGGEIGVAILRRGEDGGFPKWDSSEFGNIIDEDQIGVQINNALDTVGNQQSQVVASVIEWRIEGGAD